jgi:hypothetical protein
MTCKTALGAHWPSTMDSRPTQYLSVGLISSFSRHTRRGFRSNARTGVEKYCTGVCHVPDWFPCRRISLKSMSTIRVAMKQFVLSWANPRNGPFHEPRSFTYSKVRSSSSRFVSSKEITPRTFHYELTERPAVLNLQDNVRICFFSQRSTTLNFAPDRLRCLS